jgi:hypothetical protein
MSYELGFMKNKNQRIKRFGGGLLVATIYVSSYMIPAFAHAQGFQIVPDCAGPCGWTDFVKLLDNFLQFSVIIAVPIAAALFAWAGFLYLTARGNPGQITKASNIFLSVAIGFVVVLTSWLVIDFILKELSSADSYIRLLG